MRALRRAGVHEVVAAGAEAHLGGALALLVAIRELDQDELLAADRDAVEVTQGAAPLDLLAVDAHAVAAAEVLELDPVAAHVDHRVSARDQSVIEGEAAYTRHDGSTVSLPFVNVFEIEDVLISDYRIYIDIAPLFNP